MEILIQDPSHQPSPEEEKRKKTGIKASLIGLLANIILAISKILAGYYFHSLSIIADGMNNLSDSGSSFITLFSFIISAKPSDQKHPYGHARFEYIASSIISMIIIYFGFSVCKEALHSLKNPNIPVFHWITIGVLVFSIVVKAFMVFFYRKWSRKLSSSTLEASAADASSDVLLTLAILITSVLSPLFDLSLDGPMSLVVGIIIIKNGVEILFANFDRLMGKEPDPDFIKGLKKEISRYPGVLGVHDLLVHDYGPGMQFVTCHVVVDGSKSIISSHDQMDLIEREILRDRGIHLTIHMDPEILDDPGLDAMEGTIKKIVKEESLDYSVHDVQIRKDKGTRRIFFDMEIPWPKDKKKDEEEASIRRIQEKLLQNFPSFKIFINIDYAQED